MRPSIEIVESGRSDDTLLDFRMRTMKQKNRGARKDRRASGDSSDSEYSRDRIDNRLVETVKVQLYYIVFQTK